MLCPCGSQKEYDRCCKPFHQGNLPDNALKLMRSRYSAYALCLPDYIISTTHPQNCQFNSSYQDIEHFCLHTEFKNLEILDFQEKDDFATVTFTAHLFQNKKDVSFTERSEFEKINGKWFYLKGEIQA
jgi:uncharacterized protein YchJ